VKRRTPNHDIATKKFILDATAGFRMMWVNKHHPNCIYLDQRPECEPDIVGDFRDLKQFKDETFRLVIFDPPHIIDKWQANPEKSPFVKRFGVLCAETWQSDLKKGLLECWRILQPYGILQFKWSTHDKKIDGVLKELPFKPLIAEETKTIPF